MCGIITNLLATLLFIDYSEICFNEIVMRLKFYLLTVARIPTIKTKFV